MKTEEIYYHENKSNDETIYSVKMPNGYDGTAAEDHRVSLFILASINGQSLKEEVGCFLIPLAGASSTCIV